MSLELAVTRALYAARLIERAYHEPTGWSLAADDVRVPAVREVGSHGVAFRSVLPVVSGSLLSLYHHDELVAVQPVEVQGIGPFDLHFDVLLGDPVSA